MVLSYLIENTNFTEKQSFTDPIHEINYGYENVPEEIADAYEELTEYEMWEVIRKIAVEGKRRTK